MSATIDLAAQQENALDLVARGMAVFDLDHPSHPECIGRHRPDESCKSDRGKCPCPFSWPKGSTDVVPTVVRMFGRGLRNVAVDCGRSHLLVLDEDAPDALDALCAREKATLPETLIVETGRGRHAYFRQPDDLPFGNGDAAIRALGINVRGRGGYVVGPGSLHHTGRVYRIGCDAPIAPVPDWLALLLKSLKSAAPGPRRAPAGKCRAQIEGLLRTVLTAPEGNRNKALYWSARRLFEHVEVGNLGEPAAVAMLIDAGERAGLDPNEIGRDDRGTIGSARRAVLG